MNEDTKTYIQEQIKAARAALVTAKQDLSDAERAGLKEVVAQLRPKILDTEKQLTQLEAVYGRAP
jgi:phage shock protein A